MHDSHRSSYVSGLVGVIVGVLIATVLPAVAANGDVMLLGTRNNATRATKLIGRGGLVLTVGRAGKPALTLEVVGDTPPMLIGSTGLVTNLNADLLDGMNADAFADAAHGHAWSDLTSGIPAGLADGDDDTIYTDPEAVAAVLAADGPGSGLDADTLDGIGSSGFFAGSPAAAGGLPLLGASCLYRGGFLAALAHDGTPYCSTAGGSGVFADSGQALGTSDSMRVALGDVDGDGDLDALVNDGSLWVNDGGGAFSSSSGVSCTNPRDLALGDLDGDGDLDAFLACYGEANRVWDNDGEGTFTDSGQSLGTSNSTGVALGDLDGDGDLDAFVTNWEQHQKVWINDGTGTFADSGQTLGTTPAVLRMMGVALGDLDGDGDLDAFTVNNLSSNANYVWRNDGTGTFSAFGGYGSSTSTSVALGDLDGDGDLDAFVTNASSQANRVWTNDGDGTFTDSAQALGANNSHQVALGDLDGDGDLDAYVANVNPANGNRVWTNDGAGAFTDSAQALGDGPTYGVALGDVDGDGDLDAVTANYSSIANRVWLNG